MQEAEIGLWLACFVATIETLCAKFYFTKAIEQMRQKPAHLQREALEKKGDLAESRQNHHIAIRGCKEKEATIKRLKTQTLETEGQVKQLEEDVKKQHQRLNKKK